MTTPNDTAPAQPAQTVTDTPSGILVGADPRANPLNVSVQAGQQAVPTFNPVGTFTAEDIEKARKQEKDKLYPQIEEMRKTLAELQKERDDKLAAEQKAREEAEAALKKQQEADLDTRSLLEQKEAEWQAKLDALAAEREQERTVLQMERQFQELQAYKAQALAAASEDIIPELAGEVTATNPSSREEIDSHIARLKATSESIMNNVQAAALQARAGMRGAPVTAPPAGPMDNYSAQDTAWQAAQNGSLTFEDYLKNRDKLLSGVSRNTGLYG